MEYNDIVMNTLIDQLDENLVTENILRSALKDIAELTVGDVSLDSKSSAVARLNVAINIAKGALKTHGQ